MTEFVKLYSLQQRQTGVCLWASPYTPVDMVEYQTIDLYIENRPDSTQSLCT